MLGSGSSVKLYLPCPMNKSNYLLLPFFLGASLSAFCASVNVFDEDDALVASGDTISSVAGDLDGTTAIISANLTETAISKFTGSVTVSLQASANSGVSISGDIAKTQATQNCIFSQEGDKKTLTLNLDNLTLSNANGYVVCGVNVVLNGENAVFSGCNNPGDGSAKVGQGGVIRTTGNSNNSMSSAGTVTISGTNTFENNAAMKGGAIYAAKSVTFSGANSKAVFRGNTMSGDDSGLAVNLAGKNDIWIGGSNAGGVTIKDAGTYIFDGGIRLASTSAGKLAVSKGASVTFEGAAVNIISNTTSIVGAGVRFENAGGSNALMRDIQINKDGVLTIAEGAQIKMGTSGMEVELNATSEGSVLNIELCDAYSADGGYAAILGVEDGTNTLNAPMITLSATETYVLDLVLENAGVYAYKLIDTATVSAALTKESFELSDAWRSWEVADYSDGVVTLSYIPEPSAFAFLVGLSALVLAGTRRRRLFDREA